MGLRVLALAAALAATEGDEARVSLDVRDAPVVDVVRLLAEVGGFQVVFDPGIDCRLTLKLHEVTWLKLLETSLRACRLGREEERDILRIAPLARLEAEAASRRRLEEERGVRPLSRTRLYRLSYARAEALAPLLARHLSSRASVTFDPRTNTLIVID